MPDPGPPFSGRLVALLATAVGAVALIGLVTGTSPRTYQAKRPEPRERPPADSVPPARSHAELERRPWGSSPLQSGWLESRRIAEQAEPPEPTEPVEAPPVEDALRARAQRRAFDGAPPVVPHPVRAGGAAECLACHAEGFALGGRRARRVPHEAFASCTQCHVSSAASFSVLAANPAAAAESAWRGLESPTRGQRAYPGAPPAVPHETRMRERCESCHGADGRQALRTPHPERRSCLQCHPATGGRGDERSR
jgi:cytochrome c-type protein NapB